VSALQIRLQYTRIPYFYNGIVDRAHFRIDILSDLQIQWLDNAKM